MFSPATDIPDLSGKVYIVTGGNSGIGKYTVLHLAQQNAKVYMGARSLQKAKAAIEEIKTKTQRPDLDISILKMDMLELRSIKSAAGEFLSKENRLHGMVNNAGIMAVANGISKDGFEYQWQTNYLSHWLLTFLLTPVMELTATTVPVGTVRIVNVSSSNHKMAPPQGIDFENINLQGPGPSSNPWVRYGQSKLGNYLHALSLHQKLSEKGIWTASLHPGIVDTNLSTNIEMFAISILSSRPVIWLLRRVGFMLSTDQGSWTQLFAIAGRDFGAALSGNYLEPIAKKGTVKMPRGVTSEDLQDRLWKWTESEMKAKGFIDW
ncbi:hypothetical protein N7460_011375 [Penicillium canescens]|uniref:NAD(P)-binding protein n=2 Tax=Penicillium canescens TaxID=5083 RepID=A0AAD6I0K8_PENCN|nr:hypothetical protein N7460_011375 [Penicillium canescens]KAJ6039842.1 hypothetical protein N7444_008747 [Penicillium canescens]